MNKTWLLVIVLAIATIVVLSFTWQNIPYLNVWLVDYGVISTVQGVTTGMTDIVKGKMPISTVIPLLGIPTTITIAAIKKAFNWVKREKANTQIKLTDAQSTIGDVKSMASDMIGSVTGAKDKIQTEFDSLKVTSETQITDLKDLVDLKDNKIIDVQDELALAHKQLIAQSQELKEAVTQRDEYRIALKIKEVPTFN